MTLRLWLSEQGLIVRNLARSPSPLNLDVEITGSAGFGHLWDLEPSCSAGLINFKATDKGLRRIA